MTASRVIGAVAGAMCVVLLAAFATVVLGFRTRNAAVLGVIRRFNREIANPRELRIAGRPGSKTAVVRHRGRVTGRPFATPIGAVPAADGFVVALPYGPGVDWVRNLRAAGSGELDFDGRQYRIVGSEIVPIGTTSIGRDERAAIWLFGTREALRLRAQPVGTADPG